MRRSILGNHNLITRSSFNLHHRFGVFRSKHSSRIGIFLEENRRSETWRSFRIKEKILEVLMGCLEIRQYNCKLVSQLPVRSFIITLKERINFIDFSRNLIITRILSFFFIKNELFTPFCLKLSFTNSNVI